MLEKLVKKGLTVIIMAVTNYNNLCIRRHTYKEIKPGK